MYHYGCVGWSLSDPPYSHLHWVEGGSYSLGFDRQWYLSQRIHVCVFGGESPKGTVLVSQRVGWMLDIPEWPMCTIAPTFSKDGGTRLTILGLKGVLLMEAKVEFSDPLAIEASPSFSILGGT